MRPLPVLAIAAMIGLSAACSYDWTIVAADDDQDVSDSGTSPRDASSADRETPVLDAGGDSDVPDGANGDAAACALTTENCGLTTPCCAGLRCAASGKCVSATGCAGAGEGCGGFGGKACCFASICGGNIFDMKCAACKVNTEACANPNDCCSKKCTGNVCVP